MILGHRGHAVTAPANVDACHPSHYLSHFTAEDWGTRFACKKFIFVFHRMLVHFSIFKYCQ